MSTLPINVRAFKTGYDNSDVVTETYTKESEPQNWSLTLVSVDPPVGTTIKENELFAFNFSVKYSSPYTSEVNYYYIELWLYHDESNDKYWTKLSTEFINPGDSGRKDLSYAQILFPYSVKHQIIICINDKLSSGMTHESPIGFSKAYIQIDYK